jgi:tetratricopeptide (TPR) repeat protein
MKPLLPGTAAKEFDTLLDEAHLVADWGEEKRALQLYQQALEAAPENLSSAALADIFEAMIRLDDALKHGEHNISHARMNAAMALTCPSFCTNPRERVYVVPQQNADVVRQRYNCKCPRLLPAVGKDPFSVNKAGTAQNGVHRSHA